MKEHTHKCPICDVSHKCECHDFGGKLYQLFKACDLCFYKRMVSVPAEPRKAAAVMVILALLLFPFAQVRAQERQRSVRVPVSTAVFHETGRSFERLRVKLAMGQSVSASDLAMTSASARMMFAHMDETGLTAEWEAYVAANPSRFVDFPAEPELQEGFSKTPADQRQAFIDYVQQNGLKAYHALVIATLDKATELAYLHEQGKFVNAAFPQTQVGGWTSSGTRILPNGWTWSTVLGWTSTYLGVMAIPLAGTPLGPALGVISFGLGAIATIIGGTALDGSGSALGQMGDGNTKSLNSPNSN